VTVFRRRALHGANCRRKTMDFEGSLVIYAVSAAGFLIPADHRYERFQKYAMTKSHHDMRLTSIRGKRALHGGPTPTTPSRAPQLRAVPPIKIGVFKPLKLDRSFGRPSGPGHDGCPTFRRRCRAWSRALYRKQAAMRSTRAGDTLTFTKIWSDQLDA
jgi:hypothetical protein